MERKFEGLTKVLKDIRLEHKYLKKGKALGGSKKARNLVECP